jgi:hypothetical protein
MISGAVTKNPNDKPSGRKKTDRYKERERKPGKLVKKSSFMSKDIMKIKI